MADLKMKGEYIANVPSLQPLLSGTYNYLHNFNRILFLKKMRKRSGY